MKVAKFGGSSLASSEQLKKVINIIKADPARRFIVVSAPGKRNSDDIKVTDLLIEFYHARLAEQETASILETIFKRYRAIGNAFDVDEAILKQIYKDLQSLADTPFENNPHFYDTVLASGEDNNAKLIAGILQAEGINARYVNPKDLGSIETDEPQNARILLKSYTAIYQWRNSEETLVIP